MLFGASFVAKDEQLFLERLTSMEVINGPRTVWLPLFRKGAIKRKAISLGPLEYCFVRNSWNGECRIERGPQLLFLDPYDVADRTEEVISLRKNEFVRFVDNRTGKVRVEVGEQGQVVPTAYETPLHTERPIQTAIDLKCNEYVKIEDKATGAIRVEKGEALVFLGGYEEAIGKKQIAISVDSEHAVLVRSLRNGQQSLITKEQLFVPTEDQEIVEVRELIKLGHHEACIIRGKTGEDKFVFGSDPDNRCFFLPPHSEIVELRWSKGRRRDNRNLVLTRIDLRPQYMSFEFTCRTADNVELALEGLFFWEIVDLKAMVRFTSDTTGDICSHARSKFIERVSKVTLQEFMNDFNQIAEKVKESNGEDGKGDIFFSQRGVLIHSLEVTGYHCAEKSTAGILEQIIQETTNRMNRLQQQNSENEVQLQQIKGDVEEEKARQELLQVQIANANARAAMEGQAEAERVKSFLQGLADDVPSLEQRVSMWRTLRQQDLLSAVSSGGAHLYYTPNDVNLSIRTDAAPHAQRVAQAQQQDD